MIRTAPVIALAAALSLAGCSQEDHTIVAEGPDTRDPAAEALQANGPIALPPSIAASKSYRCGDNSLIYVDWLSDGSARVKTSKAEVGTSVPAGEGSPLKGDSSSASISYNGKSCKA